MGLFHRLNRVPDQMAMRGVWNKSRPQDWQRWAAEHGWSFQADAPELAGRWVDRIDGPEEYRYLMSSALHGRAVTSFERAAHPHVRDDEARTLMYAYIVVALPAPPVERYAAMGPDRTVREFGVEMPRDYAATFVGADLVACRAGHHRPSTLLREADLFALLVALAPAE